MDDETLVELHDPTGTSAGKFVPTDEEILQYLEDKITGKLDRSIDKYISTLKEEKEICYTHPEMLPGVSKDGQIQYFFHRPSKPYSTGTKKRRRIHTDEDGSETRWQETGNTQPVVIGGTMKGFKKILVFDSHYERHQYHLGNNYEKEGELVVSKVFHLTQLRQYGSSIKGSTWRKREASFLRGCWNGIKGSLIIPSNPVTKVINFFTGYELQASEQELPHEPDDANNDKGSGSNGSIADESIPKRGKLSQSKTDDSEGSLLSTIITPRHFPTPYQTETGGTEEQMQARITINPGSADMKNAVSRSDVVPPNSLPPAGVQAWGSASCTSLPKTASCWPNVQHPWPWGSDFTGNQNAAPTPAAQSQSPYWGQIPVNPEIGVEAHPGNQNATPRPVGQNKEPGYPGVGIGSVSMNPSFTIHSAGSSTINFNNGNTNNVSAPCWANYGIENRNPI